ncbi:MAG: alpha/beta fold hydrolase [Cyanobacteria bacterium REEB459]|nr:alpha/beta fold hydrolase [Cyanobacteria bacterium REEB459]
MQASHFPEVQVLTWTWQDLPIRYQRSGSGGSNLVLIHGFGASSDHWRYNLPELAHHHRVFAIDLLGFGFSAKPAPGLKRTPDQIPYTFTTWGEQLVAFCREVVGAPAFLIGNSIGCVVALQTAVLAPELVQGLILLNCSLRQFHQRKQPELAWHERVAVPWIQRLLGNRMIGRLFFSAIAQPGTLKTILKQAYANSDAVTDELVDLLLAPAREPGAAEVFIAFLRYSQGPLAEDLLPQIQVPVLIAWGEADPWEPIGLGRELANYPAVEEFITLPGVGHCPHDEAPQQVNQLLLRWLERHGSGVIT